MSTAGRLGAFAVVLALVLAAGLGLGRIVGADRRGADDAPGAGAAHGGTERHGGEAAATPAAVRGLASAEGGLRLVLDRDRLRPGTTATLRFRVVRDGATVRDFDVEHERRMHLVLVRRDLTGFQHLHPRQAPDGSWSVRVRVEEPGAHRVFADFVHDGAATTLARDLLVDGRTAYAAPAGPGPGDAADAGGGLEVGLAATRPRAGEATTLRLTPRRGGRPVPVEPYLGAGGHLVALRDGDLAFLHVHPEDHAGDGIAFRTTFPTEGRYALFLQVRERGAVRTAAFTVEAGR